MTTDAEAVNAAITGLDAGRRAAWRRVYTLEAELTETRTQMARAEQAAAESRRLASFAAGALEVLAPSLVPWLQHPFGVVLFVGNGPNDGYREACGSDNADELREAGRVAGRAWLAAPATETDGRDWRALQLLRWYHDRTAPLPLCVCGETSWEHEGPAGRCLNCGCDALDMAVGR